MLEKCTPSCRLGQYLVAVKGRSRTWRRLALIPRLLDSCSVHRRWRRAANSTKLSARTFGKVVQIKSCVYMLTRVLLCVLTWNHTECRAFRDDIRRARRPAHPGLRRLPGGEHAAREDGLQHRHAPHRGFSRALRSRTMCRLSRRRRGRRQGATDLPLLACLAEVRCIGRLDSSLSSVLRPP